MSTALVPPPPPSPRSEPLPGTAFLRVLRRPRGTLWRLLLVIVGVVLGLIVPPVAVLFAADGIGRALGTGYSFSLADGVGGVDMLVVNLGLALLIGWAALLVRVLYGVRPRWLCSNRPGMRWKWLGICFLVAGVVWALLLFGGTAGALAIRKAPLDAGVWLFLVVVLVTTPLQAAGEEFLFRGLLLQSFGAPGWPLLVCGPLDGVLFAVAHLQFDWPLFLDRALLGTVLAFLAGKTAGIESGIAIHSVYNLSALVPEAFLNRVGQTLEPHAVSFLPLVIHAIQLAIIVPWLLALARRHVGATRQLSPPALPPPSFAA